MLRMSQLFLRTLREDPSDAEVPSHRLLVRAGYVRRVAAGIYSWLPLGKIVLENITRVVRTEMNAMGGQEVLLPALLPREPYEATGRWDEYGSQLFRLTDRRDGDYLLGPTHEEIFTLMVKGECSSYKDLPVILYQIQTKYRDEARPRSGILRGREFLMKDSYSFDVDDAGLRKSYDLHRDAYIRIFDRLGLRYRMVSAVSGAMGGSASEEFLAPSPSGEDDFVACGQCDYAANVEAVQVRPPDVDATVPHPALELLDTPATPTIDTLAEFLGVPASVTLKNLLVTTESGEIVAVGVPGDRDVDLDRLAAVLGPIEIFDDFESRTDLVKGYIGPQGLPADVRYVADPRIAPGTVWVTGANEVDRHARGVVCGRDFAVPDYADVATVRSGDPCPRCGAALELDRAIEIGHIFQLGRKYCDVFDLDVLGPDGKPARVTMGSYGIGVSRAVAALAEQTHDQKGLCWPREVAPADVHVVATGKDGQVAAALQLGGELEARGLRVLVDDRQGASPGVKFADAELIGVPTILIVGRGLAAGMLELRDRATGAVVEIGVDEVVDHLAPGISG
ncbi:MAG: Prolyl-tRNA synthetase [Streptosporangiaceae bacterium]|nr:Prolyl-tRNA synthetase [Streptosporangiaceae bacterium]